MRVAALVMIAGAATAQQCGVYEAVEPGDTMSEIVARCGVEPAELRAANPGVDFDAPLVAGSVLAMTSAAGLITDVEIDVEAPAPDAIARDPDVAQIYAEELSGRWGENFGTCGSADTTWTFAEDSVRRGETVYELLSISSSDDDVALDVVANDEEEAQVLRVELLGPGRIQVIGAQLRRPLRRCP